MLLHFFSLCSSRDVWVMWTAVTEATVIMEATTAVILGRTSIFSVVTMTGGAMCRPIVIEDRLVAGWLMLAAVGMAAVAIIIKTRNALDKKTDLINL